ncbi:MAG: sulfurtransferase [Cyclobacteriaceae bacterium]|jgi:thiosulfate/3-mercaptopyruvate sulfurtransferase|nr:sulfurtransferase [Cyclobacteriaceae bacterium]
MNELNPLITASELLAIKGNPDLLVFDASAGANAKANYEANHLEGALYVDTENQLATPTPNAANGGRHPLPTLEKFSEVLGLIGVAPGSHVVIYDDKQAGNAAARFWWMLQAIGHAKVQVLSGGLQSAKAVGYPMSAKKETIKPQANYPIHGWQLPMVSLEEVKIASNQNNATIVDVRSAERFDGITEPIDLIAGHIPGAVNIPFTTNLNAQGEYLSPKELKEKYTKAFEGQATDQVIVHCGSGITACHTLLAMAAAGLAIPKLYVGSWSEWSRNDLPMVLAK